MKLALPTGAVPRRAFVITLALAAAATLVAGRERPALELAEARPAPAAQSSPAIDLAKLERSEAPAPQANPFAPRSFAPPPARQAAAPRQAPSAPPLPFTYAGRLTQEGRTEVFVLRGEELISIAPGQSIDGQYRVDAISDTRIAFTYLPLKTRQSIELSELPG